MQLRVENKFRVSSSIWDKLDEQEKHLFNKAFARTERERFTIIQSLSEECRPEMQGHFSEIAASVCAYFIKELHQYT